MMGEGVVRGMDGDGGVCGWQARGRRSWVEGALPLSLRRLDRRERVGFAGPVDYAERWAAREGGVVEGAEVWRRRRGGWRAEGMVSLRRRPTGG